MADAVQAIRRFGEAVDRAIDSSLVMIKSRYEGWDLDLYQHDDGTWTAALRGPKNGRYLGHGGGKLDALADLEAALSERPRDA